MILKIKSYDMNYIAFSKIISNKTNFRKNISLKTKDEKNYTKYIYNNQDVIIQNQN